jgi:hypothetical protein
LNARVEAKHATLVLHQVEHVGRASRYARFAAGTAIIVDAVNQQTRRFFRRAFVPSQDRAAQKEKQTCREDDENADGHVFFRTIREECKDRSGFARKR